jgi:hypothetical protein
VERLGKQDDANELVRMIVGLGKALSLRIVAEGVETGAQLEALRGMGCDVAQGFLFMRPVPDWCIDELIGLGPNAPVQGEPILPAPPAVVPAARTGGGVDPVPGGAGVAAGVAGVPPRA